MLTIVYYSPEWLTEGAKDGMLYDSKFLERRSDFTVPTPIPSTHFCIWAGGSTWRHTGKHGFSAPQTITNYQSTDLLIERIASPTWSSTERVGRPATKRFHSKQLVQNDTHVVNRTPHTKVNSGMSRLIRLFMWLGRWTVDVVLTVVHLDDFTSGGNWTLLQEPRMTTGL